MDTGYLTTVILTLVVAGTHAVPVTTTSARGVLSSCVTTCTESSKFSYQPGKTYIYKYEVETKSLMMGVSDDHSTIGITARAAIHVISKCELEMQIVDASVFGYDSKQYKDQDRNGDFANALKKYPIKFSFQDGMIDSVYPVDEEAVWAVNIKKGMLSAFQNSMEKLDEDYSGTENDVAGSCDTEYKMATRGWRTLNIKKTKDITKCSHRQGFDSAIQTTPFRISSGLKSLPLLKGSQECDQEVNTNGILASSVCHEIQVYRPFSNRNNGATTETTQKLTLVQERDEVNNNQGQCGEGEPLFFRHVQTDPESELPAREALTLLQGVCRSTINDVTPQTSKEFSALVQIMKRMNFNGLRRIYNQVRKDSFCAKNKDRVRKFAMDAYPMVGTHESVKLMKTLISNDDVTGTQADAWLASLAFIHHPTPDMLQEVMQLMGLPSQSTKVLLPLSGMVHTYCRHNARCMDVIEVRQIVQMMEKNIQGDCTVTQANFRTIIMSLRALGNSGQAGSAIPSLYNCMLKRENPMDIRVAAVQAFRRLSCAEDRNNLMELFRNTDEDSELRNTAYLAVMQCPSGEFISQIKQTLMDEPVNQVGSFVWTHLTNLMESTDPANQYVQHLLNGEDLQKDFDMDRLQFSRNYEGSFFMERLNAGAKADGNLIWSTKSFVPRSASLNLTFDMFGETMNLFEIGGRVEGLDHLLETYFGPKGYYNNENKDSDNNIPDADPTVAGLSTKKLKSINSKGQFGRDELRGAMYLRMFGNELSYTMFGNKNGIDSDSPASGSDMFNFLTKLRTNEKQELSLTKSFMFIDSTYTVPTIAGLPLNLKVNGTATVALNAEGQINLKKPRSSVLFEGSFEPSGAVVMDSTMSVDAFVTRGGLKMVSTLHTSTGAKGKLQLTNQNVLDFAFDLTKDKSEIFDVRSEFFMVYDEIEMKMTRKINSDHVIDVCSGDKMERFAGVELCASMSMPNTTGLSDIPSFPLAGPVSGSIILNKKDMPNGYKLEAKVIKTPEQTLFRVMSDTAGSKHDRAVGIDLVVQHRDRSINVNFISPWKKATMTGQVFDKRTIKGLTGVISVDGDARVYNLDAKIVVDDVGNRRTYTPTVKLEIPEWKHIQLTGLVTYKQKQMFDADIKITGALDDPIILQTSITNTPSKVGMTAKFNHKQGDGYQLEAVTSIEKKRKTKYSPVLSVKTPEKELIKFGGIVLYAEGKALKVDTKLEKITKDPIVIQGDVTKLSYAKKKRDKYSLRMTVSSKKWFTKLMTVADYRPGKNLMNKVRLDYNFGRKKKDTIVVNTRVRMNVSKFRRMYKVISNMNSMKNNELDCLLNLNFIQKKFSTTLKSTFKHGKNLKAKNLKERLDLTLSATHKERNSRYQLNYTVMAKYPAKEVDVTVTGGHIHDDKSLSNDIAVKYHPERTVSVGIVLQNRSMEFLNYAGSVQLNLPQNREMQFAIALGKENENKYISNIQFEVIKGRRTSIDSMLKIATHSVYEVEFGIQAPDVEPLRIIGGYIREDSGAQVFASFKRGEHVYSASMQTMMREKAGKVSLDVNVPSRHVILVVNGYKKDTEMHGMLDIQWDADNNTEDRFLTNITTDFKSWDDFELMTVLQYPVRRIDFTIKHSSAARYITNIELSWSPQDILQVAIVFRDDLYEGATRTELSVEFKSPFKRFEDLGLSFSLVRNSQQYQMKSSVTWAPRQKISVTGTAKIPVTVNSVDIVGRIRTPFKTYKQLNALIKHRMNDDIDSSVLVQWGSKRLSLGVNGAKLFTDRSGFFNATIDLRTPFEGMRVLVIKAQHDDNSKKYVSKFSVETAVTVSQREWDKYMIETESLKEQKPGGLGYSGKIQVNIPNDDITTTWEVTSQTGKIHLELDIKPRRDNRFKVAFTESHQFKPNRKFLSTFELIVPTQELKHLLVSLEHEDMEGYVKTGATVTKDNEDIYASDVIFKYNVGSVEMMSQISSQFTNPIIFSMTSYHSLMPYRGNLQLEWAPQQKINMDSNFFTNEFGVVDVRFKVTTPFPQVPQIVLLSKRERRGLNWETTSSLEYGPQQKIIFDSIYRFDHVKLTSISMKTHFPQFSSVDTSFRIEGSPINLRGEAEFTLQPYVQKVSTDFNWAYYEGTSLTGAFNLNTPFQQYPYMKAKVDSNKLGRSRVSSFEIEYLPTQKFILESDYYFSNIETLEGTVKVTSPYTENQQVVGTFTHIGDREEFKTKARITCDCYEKPVNVNGFFSSKSAIKSTFDMESPFRGYETVKWNFLHEGKIEDFRTVLEYQTNNDKIAYENSFSMKENVKGQIVLETPFKNVSKALLAFSHDGNIPNSKTHAEVALNTNMITSDLTLAHNDESSLISALVKTPFKRYRTVTAKLERSGGIHDLSAVGEVVYDLTWHGSIKHKFDGENVLTSAVFQTPFTEDDIIMKFNYTGKPLNFESKSEYSIGPKYSTTSNVRFLYALPNLLVESKSVQVLGDNTTSYGITLKHNQDIAVLKSSNYDVDISSSFVIYMNDQKVNLHFGCRASQEGANMDGKVLAVAELPFEQLNSNKIFYEYNVQDLAGDMKQKNRFTLESPLCETVTAAADSLIVGGTFNRTTTYTYGDMQWVSDEYFKPGHYRYFSSFPKQEGEIGKAEFVFNYNGNIWNNEDLSPERTLGVDATLTSTEISPVTLSYNVQYQFKENDGLYANGKYQGSYGDDKILVRETLRPGSYNTRVSTPFEGYRKCRLNVNYDYTDGKIGGDVTVTGTPLKKPVTAALLVQYNSLEDLQFSTSFTSEFTNFTDLRAAASMSQSDNGGKRHISVSWEDHEQVKQELLTEGSWTWNLPESGTIDVGIGLALRTPHDAVKDASVMFDLKQSLSPVSIQNTAMMQHNGKKYFDYDSQVSTVDKILGGVNFRAPRKMAFSFNGLNEAESVEGDLNLNWNQEEDDSLFRLQFGLADKGDLDVVMKMFHVRVTNPGRIVSVENQYENSAGKISTNGRISWDEAKKQEVSYRIDCSKEETASSLVYNSNVEVTVPVRRVVASGSVSSAQDAVKASTNVRWDADRDQKKQVEIHFVATPYSAKKAVQVDVLLPMIDKEVSLKSELESNAKHVTGETTFSYSKDDDKDVVLQMNIQKDYPSYRGVWSLDHTATRTHVKATTSLSNADSVSSADAKLKYLTSGGKNVNLIFHSELDSDNRVLKVQTTTPDNVMELSGHMTSESPYLVTMKTSRNSRPVWTAMWKVNTMERTLDGSMTYGDTDKTMAVEAYFPNKTSFVSETNRETTDDLIREGRVSAELNNRLLHGHLQWRPQLVYDALNFSGEVLKEFTSQVSSVLGAGSKDLGTEMMAKFRAVSTSLKEELSQLSDSLEGEVKLVQRDLRAMRRELKRMHRQNDLYLRTLEVMYTGAVKNMLAGYSKAIGKLNQVYIVVEEAMEEVTNKINEYPFKEKYDKMMETVKQGITEAKETMRQEIDESYKLLTEKLAELTQLYDDAILDMSNYLREVVTGVIDELMLTPHLEDVRKMLDNYTRVSNIQIQKFLNQVHKLVIDTMDAESWSEKYRLVYERSQEILAVPIADILDNEDVREIYSSLVELYKQVSWIYKYTEMDISFRELLDKLLENARQRVMKEFNQLPLGILDMHKSKFITFDLDSGEVEFDLYLPIPMENFDELMRFSVRKYINRWSKKLDKYFPRRDINLWDFYYSLKPVQWGMRKDWVPPYNVFATVSGTQHYTTFDGNHFDFAGMCSYVLLEDLVDGNFTVVQKYEGSRPSNLVREALVVMVDGKTIEIPRTYMVQVDGQPKELPYITETLSITREGSNIVLKSDLGLSIISNFDNEYHVIMLNGWYFGKVGGLLGTYNNEWYDDMTIPDGRLADRSQLFMNAWEVSQSCRKRGNHVKTTVQGQSEECAAMFEQSSSALRPCFSMVKPEHYKHSCEVGSAPACDIAALYRKTCAQRGITVTLPDSCVQCSTSDNALIDPKSSMKFESDSTRPLRQSMDVVFIVEERQCNRDVANKLKNVIFEIEEKLVRTGTTGNQYSLVGYAGTGTYSHTMEGQLFNDASKFAMGLENLQFNNLGPVSDPTGAIRYAISLPFRAGVRKMFVLVSCSPCQETLGYPYLEMSSELSQLDITMHVLRQGNFHLKNNRNTPTRIYGVDGQDVFVGRQQNRDDDLFSQIDIPSDYCSSLALASNGSVFDIRQMMIGTMRQKKMFLSKMGSRVGQTGPGADCQTCTCELDQTGTPRSVCRRCDTKPIYFKPFSGVYQSAVDVKNTISSKLQSILL